jgi:hypothetical protein
MSSEFQYKTIGGDAFDSISWDLFGSEKYMGDIMRANRDYMDVVNFDASILLTIPVVEVKPNASSVPWGQFITTPV